MQKRLIVGSALVLVGAAVGSLVVSPPTAASVTSQSNETTNAMANANANANDVALGDAPSFQDDGTEDISGELVVDLKDGLSESEIAALGREYNIDLRDNSPDIKDDGNIELTDLPPGQMQSVMDRLEHDSRVEHVEQNFMFHESWVPNDPKYQEQWHLTRVGAETAWNYSCGQGVTVAVVDTGIACYDAGGFMKGTDLNGTRCVGGYNFVAKNDVAADDQGHGTHVAGTIAQTTNNGHGVAGLAYCASLMPVKVLNRNGSGTMADVGEGIRYAADHGAQVINLSLGASRGAKVVKDAVDHALAKGVVVVAAAGNSGRSVGYPAAYPGVIAVSATDKNDNIAWFSSRGKEVVIGAPGVAVTQQTICQGGKNKCEVFGVFNGTSMASPHVAGIAAMLVSQGVTDGDAVRDALTSTAKPKENKEQFGAGIADAQKATTHVWWWHALVRFLALNVLGFLVFRAIRKKGGDVAKGAGAVVGSLLGAVGLVPFLPTLGLARFGNLRPFLETLSRPLGEWDIVWLGVGFHKYMVLASALPAIALTALMFGSKRLRPFVGGVALGTAALLTQSAISGDAAFFAGAFAMKLFAVANVAVCLWLAKMSLNSKA